MQDHLVKMLNFDVLAVNIALNNQTGYLFDPVVHQKRVFCLCTVPHISLQCIPKGHTVKCCEDAGI